MTLLVSESVIDPETSSGWHYNILSFWSWNKFRMTFFLLVILIPKQVQDDI